MSDIITHASDATFDALVKNPDKLVLVDFWADWCGPCKALAPTLDDIAEDYADQLSVVKMDIVANEATANRLGVQSIPLLVFYKGGEEVDRAVGMLSKSRLAALVDRHL
jgi:thioredoxin 1